MPKKLINTLIQNNSILDRVGSIHLDSSVENKCRIKKSYFGKRKVKLGGKTRWQILLLLLSYIYIYI